MKLRKKANDANTNFFFAGNDYFYCTAAGCHFQCSCLQFFLFFHHLFLHFLCLLHQIVHVHAAHTAGETAFCHFIFLLKNQFLKYTS